MTASLRLLLLLLLLIYDRLKHLDNALLAMFMVSSELIMIVGLFMLVRVVQTFFDDYLLVVFLNTVLAYDYL